MTDILLWANVPPDQRVEPHMLGSVHPNSLGAARADIAHLLHPQAQCPASVPSSWSSLQHLYQPCAVEAGGRFCARHNSLNGGPPFLDRRSVLTRLKTVCQRGRISTLSQHAAIRPGQRANFGPILFNFVHKSIADGDTAD